MSLSLLSTHLLNPPIGKPIALYTLGSLTEEPLKEVVKETTFKGAHQKVNVPWEDTKGIVLKKSWEKVSFDVLKSLNKFVQ